MKTNSMMKIVTCCRCRVLLLLIFVLDFKITEGVTTPSVPNHPSSSDPLLQCSTDTVATGDCLKVLFHRYGNSHGIVFAEFERLVHSIGLGVTDEIPHIKQATNTYSDNLHENIKESNSSYIVHLGDKHESDSHLHECLSPKSLLAAVNLQTNEVLNTSQFLQLCPILLQQIDSNVCMTDTIRLNATPSSRKEVSMEDETHHTSQIWGFSLAAITGISLASIFCILTVPCVQNYPKSFHRLLAFLVALAVGSLSGDAILHLIPHAFIPHAHDSDLLVSDSDGHDEHDGHDGHESNPATSTEHLVIFKGLTVICGIYLFFLFEQILQSFNNRTKSVGVKKTYLSLQSNEDAAVESKVSHRYESQQCEEEKEDVEAKVDMDQDQHKSADQQQGGQGSPVTFIAKDTNDELPLDHHGHSHNFTGSMGITNLAWVIVIGDAFHNLIDGMVVGSAFVDSLAGGLSTSIAIMCHEIPHELGDFAVMLKAGMSIKQALGFQAVSSVLSYIGMALGIALGNINSAVTWMFAFAAGMFLYIALVDLFPEMVSSANQSKDDKMLHLVLQVLGVFTGCGIMLIIALGESTLLELLGG